MTPDPSPWRALACAIIKRAILDAKSNGHAASARRWLLTSPWCADILDALDLDRGAVLAWVRDLPDVGQIALDL